MIFNDVTCLNLTVSMNSKSIFILDSAVLAFVIFKRTKKKTFIFIYKIPKEKPIEPFKICTDENQYVSGYLSICGACVVNIYIYLLILFIFFPLKVHIFYAFTAEVVPITPALILTRVTC